MVRIDMDHVPLGTAIVVTAKTGRAFSGVLREVSDSHILLQHSQGEVILSTDLIGAWEISDGSVEPQQPSEPVAGSSNIPPLRVADIERLSKIETKFAKA